MEDAADEGVSKHCACVTAAMRTIEAHTTSQNNMLHQGNDILRMSRSYCWTRLLISEYMSSATCTTFELLS